MAKAIAERELRNDTARVIDAVAGGETFVVTRNGEPVAELRPIRAHRDTFISREEIAALAPAGVRIDRHQFRVDLDQQIDQERGPCGGPDGLNPTPSISGSNNRKQ